MIDMIDHFVLTVRDIGAACDFYARTLGMQVVTFGNGRKALQFGEFGEHKINLHEAGKEFEPKASKPTPGSGDVCFITRTPLERVVGHLRSCDVEILDGPVKRTGARGPIESVYIRDPDGNLIEIANYLPRS
jgi:catechol 2,3-dioxygenase-like lactoylglutathione lyase family enzyme